MTNPTAAPGAELLLGLGGCIDWELEWDAAIIARLADQYAIREDELDPETRVATERDLLRALLGFMRSGRGGEAYVEDPASIAALGGHLSHAVALGGTNVRASLLLDKLGIPSTLHLVTVDDTFRRLLPTRGSYLSSGADGPARPHLILQFREGEVVETCRFRVEAPRSNRVIFVHDPQNAELLLSPVLGAAIEAADVVLLSGFNSIRDVATLSLRVTELLAALDRRRPGTIVFYEDGGFHVPAMSRTVAERIGAAVQVHSLNEDELEGYVGRPVDLLDVDDVRSAIESLLEWSIASTVVVHTRHWAAAIGDGSARYREALEHAVAVSGARYLHGDGIDASIVADVRRATVDAEGRRFAAAIQSVAPAVTCVPAHRLATATPTTIGLGDSFVAGFLASLSSHRWRTLGDATQ